MTRGRSESGSDWMSSIKSTFSKLKTSTTNAIDSMVEPTQQTQGQPIQSTPHNQQQPVSPALDDIANIDFELPKSQDSKLEIQGNSFFIIR